MELQTGMLIIISLHFAYKVLKNQFNEISLGLLDQELDIHAAFQMNEN